ncbi:L,D-transpeptidase family protein [bacterium]|nr:L,D-transpeptidase family protein [bacterium]
MTEASDRPPLKNKFRWLPAAAGALIASGIILGSVYLYKINNFSIEQVSADSLIINGAKSESSELYLTSDSPQITVSYKGIPSEPIKVEVDGKAVAMSSNWLTGAASGRVNKIADGKHVVSVAAKDYSESWLVTLDTTPPEVKISHPQPNYKSNKKSITLQGTTEPDALIKASSAGTTLETTANEKGYFFLTLPTESGKSVITWEVRDKAGNKTEGKNEFLCDFTPPVLDISVLQPAYKDNDGKEHDKITVGPKTPYTILTGKSLTLKTEASDKESGIAKIEVYIDDDLRETKDCTGENRKPVKTDSGEESSNIDDTTVVPAEQKPLDSTSLIYNYNLPVLYEGTHTVSVVAYDAFGLSTRRNLTFCTNTTDVYGQAPMGRGAVGDDVKELQRRLTLNGYLEKGYVEGKFDQKTYDAVIKIQKELGLTQDSIAGVLVTAALSTKIYVNLERFSAVLVDEANGARYYSIATGVEEHPTPAGFYYISDMAKNPTWLPPNSEWAKDSKQIPPGPDNPLGTRWIGIGNAIGFHGTPYPGTVGTRASHGCMRMAIPDIEDLYERVSVGTQVHIFNGGEDDPILKKYWP